MALILPVHYVGANEGPFASPCAAKAAAGGNAMAVVAAACLRLSRTCNSDVEEVLLTVRGAKPLLGLTEAPPCAARSQALLPLEGGRCSGGALGGRSKKSAPV
mmetsp:Transcript_50292/g.103494  ORF Transcript_50292/g.103494 Transcript_50292/m.103494 type:complete len:103 (+) Transcript_50292:71-379(+)